MNLEEETHQAQEDHRDNKNGFEKAKNWKSSIKELGKKPENKESKK